MSESPVKPRTFAILLALADGPRHGYGVMRALRTDPVEPLSIGPATLYRALKEMESQGLISGTEGPDDSGGPPRRYFKLTPLGQRVGSREAARLSGLAARWHRATG